jgi:catechol 2,3-dioxygenase-like lactoylglutathione lyase family enzyme
MLRVKDPVASLKFYIEILGMTLVKISPSEGGKFTNYFLSDKQRAAAAGGRNEEGEQF